MLKNFTVIELMSTRSDSVAVIKGNTLKFNMQTAAELDHPAFVEFLIFPKEKQFAIRPCKEDEKNAVRFSKPKGEQKYKISVTHAVIGKMIRKMADWGENESWNVPAIYQPEDDALVYDLRAAWETDNRGGWPEKRRRKAAADKLAAESEK